MNPKFYLRLLCAAVAVGSGVFGYDTAVISGTVEALRTHFHLTDSYLGWVVGSVMIGCIIGVLVVGRLTDWLGRRLMLIVSALLFLLSSLWCYAARSPGELVYARILSGTAIGFTCLLVPIYIAEIAPPKIRGALVSLNQFGIVFGMNLAFGVNAWIGHGSDAQWLADTGWRVMFGAGALPALILLVLIFFIPESPRWLIKRGRDAAALIVLRRLHGEGPAEAEAGEIREAVTHEQGSVRELFRPGVRGIMYMAMALALFQTTTGINAVMYYAPTIFTNAGLGIGSALSRQVIIGLGILTGTIGSIFLVDRAGRRVMMMVAVTGMAVSLGLMGVFFSQGGGGSAWLLVCTLTYVFSFNVGLGGVYWVVISEIFPTRIRGAASSLSIIFLWAGNFLVSLLFPAMLDALKGNVFYVFTGICVLCFAFIWFFVPETKGKSLERIEHELYGV